MWKSIFKEMPQDQETVWIRVMNIYGELAQATYFEAEKLFRVELTQVDIPVYFVARWKSL